MSICTSSIKDSTPPQLLTPYDSQPPNFIGLAPQPHPIDSKRRGAVKQRQRSVGEGRVYENKSIKRPQAAPTHVDSVNPPASSVAMTTRHLPQTHRQSQTDQRLSGATVSNNATITWLIAAKHGICCTSQLSAQPVTPCHWTQWPYTTVRGNVAGLRVGSSRGSILGQRVPPTQRGV